MTITTPSGYVVEFKGEDELTYGDRRSIQRAMVKSVKIGADSKVIAMTGDALFEAQESTLSLILKSIQRPDGSKVEGDLLAEVLGWKTQADGDAVFALVGEAMQQSPKEKVSV